MFRIRDVVVVLPLVAVLGACGGGGTEAIGAAEQTQSAPAATETADASMLRAVNSPCQFYGPLDGNEDGAIGPAEYGNFANIQFDRWDLDSNGAVSRSEFDRCVSDGGYTRVVGSFRAFDGDGNGALSKGEFFAEGAYSQLDANGSGTLENAEWKSAA